MEKNTPNSRGGPWQCGGRVRRLYLFLYKIDICTEHYATDHCAESKEYAPIGTRGKMVTLSSVVPLRNQTHGWCRQPCIFHEPAAENQDTMQTAEYANSIASEAMPAALAAQDIERAWAQDPTLLLVSEAVASGDWCGLSACPPRNPNHPVTDSLETHYQACTKAIKEWSARRRGSERKSGGLAWTNRLISS